MSAEHPALRPVLNFATGLLLRAQPVRARSAALGVTHIHLGIEDKRLAAEAVLAELGLDWLAAAAMGDDWPDRALRRRAALACGRCAAELEAAPR